MREGVRRETGRREGVRGRREEIEGGGREGGERVSERFRKGDRVDRRTWVCPGVPRLVRWGVRDRTSTTRDIYFYISRGESIRSRTTTTTTNYGPFFLPKTRLGTGPRIPSCPQWCRTLLRTGSLPVDVGVPGVQVSRWVRRMERVWTIQVDRICGVLGGSSGGPSPLRRRGIGDPRSRREDCPPAVLQ